MNEMDEDDDDDVDLFEELGVGAPTANSPASDPLEAFLEDDEGDGEIEQIATEIVEIQVVEEDEDEDDPFVTLGVSGPSVALTTDDSEDPLAALMEDDEDDGVEEEEVEEETPEAAPSTETVSMDSIAAYRMVLETVWVDGILDPGEVSLLAGRRKELGISFEEHLTLVRDMLG